MFELKKKEVLRAGNNWRFISSDTVLLPDIPYRIFTDTDREVIVTINVNYPSEPYQGAEYEIWTNGNVLLELIGHQCYIGSNSKLMKDLRIRTEERASIRLLCVDYKRPSGIFECQVMTGSLKVAHD